MMPKRIQLSRKAGWRKPEGAIVVSRPSKWGNPYTVDHYRSIPSYEDMDIWDLRYMATSDFGGMVAGKWGRQHRYPPLAEIRAELAGKDLCCWCPLDQPCHADVLLELANGPADAGRRIEASHD